MQNLKHNINIKKFRYHVTDCDNSYKAHTVFINLGAPYGYEPVG